MKYELIICEKPSAAKKIASALADYTPIKKNNKGVPYYEITHNKKDIVVACAVGHLYTVAEKDKKGWTYPVFETEWQPTAKVDKKASFATKYLTTIKKLAKDANIFTIACDYDIEGETIGFNILTIACKQKDGKRMKFSTLTKGELVNAYENAQKHIDWGQANAGTTRHVLDYYYGINLSRALSLSVKAVGAFKILSTGRVQGPALKIIVDKEKEIKAFKPEPYWQIELKGDTESTQKQKNKEPAITALHKQDKFWEKEKAQKSFDTANQNKDKAVVEKVARKQFKQQPPHPFDLTTLQTEAYRSMKIQPKQTLALAQELYVKGLISYPRTSSQELPKSIGFAKILKQLTNQTKYAELANTLLKLKNLTPNNGKKKDPAHPAIFPTGLQQPLDGYEAKIYDIIVRRFMATFGEPAVRETMTITIDIAEEDFIAKGTRTVEKGWHIFYGPHVKIEEITLPDVKEQEKILVKKLSLLDKETQPPKRYTPASIIKELEKRGLGTKATRAAIVEALYKRGYVNEKSIQATDLGIRTCETLEKYSPKILDEELTRHFEEELEKIREDKKKGTEVLNKAKSVLTKILKEFKAKEKQIGKELLEANVETRKEQSFIGPCKKCESGTLEVRKGKFGRFAACDGYPKCKTTFSLPNTGKIKSAKKECESCKHPLIIIQQPKRAPQEACINTACKSKAVSKEERKEHEKPCPKCKQEGRKKGRMVVRKSVYGSFMGCTNYPKCRNNEQLNGNDNGEKK